MRTYDDDRRADMTEAARRKTATAAVREDAVRRGHRQGRSDAAIARALGVNDKTVRRIREGLGLSANSCEVS